MKFGADSFYTEPAAAYVRGAFPDSPSVPEPELVAWASAQGERVHRFKRKIPLPRVEAAVGILLGLSPSELLDIGTGRGTFLWPLRDRMPWLPVTSLEASPERFRQLADVQAGGYPSFTAVHGTACRMPFEDGEFDAVTALEVLEHIEDHRSAAREIMRVARRAVVVSVPSVADDNPEHLRVYSRQDLGALLEASGAARVAVTQVHGHLFAFARKG